MKAFLNTFKEKQITLRQYIDLKDMTKHITDFNGQGLKDIVEKFTGKKFSKFE